MSGNVPDADITGMTLTAFAPYYLSQEKYEQTDATYSYDEFASAVERGILVLANMQKPTAVLRAGERSTANRPYGR